MDQSYGCYLAYSERSLKGGQLNEFWWLSHHEKFPELEEYFPRHHYGLWEFWRIFWNQKYLLEPLQIFQYWVRGCEWAGEWSMFIGLYSIFYIFDIESMTKFILDVNFSMSVKLDEWHVERGCGSLSPLRDWTWHWCDKHSSSFYWRSWTIGRYPYQTWIVLTFLYGRKGYGSWFEMLSLVSVTLYWAWVTLDTSLRLYSVMWQWANAFGSIRYASESVCDAYWTSMSILDFASHISDVCEAFYTIVSMWDTPALWGQCLRILFDLWIFGLEVHLCDLYILRLSVDVWLR